MTSTRNVYFDARAATLTRGQQLNKNNHVRKLFDTAGTPYRETVKDGSDTTDGSGDVTLDLSDKFASIENAIVKARGTTGHHLQVQDYTPATFTFRSFDSGFLAEGTTLVEWSATIEGTKV